MICSECGRHCPPNCRLQALDDEAICHECVRAFLEEEERLHSEEMHRRNDPHYFKEGDLFPGVDEGWPP
jgi:hypothetical protein